MLACLFLGRASFREAEENLPPLKNVFPLDYLGGVMVTTCSYMYYLFICLRYFGSVDFARVSKEALIGMSIVAGVF